jgi:hypothetical protein
MVVERASGRVDAAALALIVALLAGCDTAGAAERYEGYGPVEEYLTHPNDPPVPEPVGPRYLRDIPRIGEAMKTWPAFFRDLELDLHFRTIYRNQDASGGRCTQAGCPDSIPREAWAVGGWLGLQSGWLLDTFRVGATGYISEPAYAPDSRDGTLLLGPGQTGIEVIGEAFAQLRYRDHALLTGYRQLVDQRFVNPQDNRMIPNTFEGATLTGVLGPVEYYAGYLTAMKTRNSDEFVNMAAAAGVTTGEDRGLILTSLDFAPGEGSGALAGLEGLAVYLGNYHVPDVFNTLFFNPEYRRALTEEWRLRLGVQFLDQRSVGSELRGDFSTWNVGARIEVGWRGLGVLGMMSATGPDRGLLKPYGATPAYVSLISTDFDRANEKAWEVGITYDWGGTTFPALRVPGLFTSLLYGEGFDARSASGRVRLPTLREANVINVWRPPRVPGLQIRVFGSVSHESDKDELFHLVGIALDFEMPLF